MSVSDEPVPSPCMSICALDNDDVCIGCHRTGLEISYWGRLSREQQREVVRRSSARMQGEHHPCLVQENR